MSDEKLFDQEELNKVVQKRIREEKERHADELTNVANQLTESQDKNKELEEKYSKVKDIAEEVPTLKRAKLVAEVAEELELPRRLVGRITGETREEIEADVKSLMADLEPLSSGGIPGIPGSAPAKPKLSAEQKWLEDARKTTAEGRK